VRLGATSHLASGSPNVPWRPKASGGRFIGAIESSDGSVASRRLARGNAGGVFARTFIRSSGRLPDELFQKRNAVPKNGDVLG
jgi:hypothetical protein